MVPKFLIKNIIMNYALDEYMSPLQGSSVVGISEQCLASTAYYIASLRDWIITKLVAWWNLAARCPQSISPRFS